jgi:hypothetical protein
MTIAIVGISIVILYKGLQKYSLIFKEIKKVEVKK